MCDTIIISKRLTQHRQNILAKNSDRPLGECQPLALFPEGTKRELPPYVKEEDLRLFDGTGISASGSRYPVLGSRPYWLYGFEMGANSEGLFIGNEAEGSRCPAETEEGILGMDLLRYALEACSNGQEAIALIAALLEKYGQNANASPLFDRRYENSFILCDPKELWVMETAGRFWAARKITWFEAVSNCYTIGTDWDLCAEGMEAYVRKHRLVHPEDPVDFAKAFTRPAPRQRGSVPRRNRMTRLFYEMLLGNLEEEEQDELADFLDRREFSTDQDIYRKFQKLGSRVETADLSYIFQDHFEEEVNEYRFGPLGGETLSICMHANTWDESQTAASMFMTYDKALGLKFFWAPASPCTSLYLPVWWVKTENGRSAGPRIPALLSAGSESYDPASLWWVLERLVTLVSVCEERYQTDVLLQLDAVEAHSRQAAVPAELKAENLIKKGAYDEAQALLDDTTEQIVGELLAAAALLCDSISEDIAAAGGLYGPRKEFVEEFAARVGMPV